MGSNSARCSLAQRLTLAAFEPFSRAFTIATGSVIFPGRSGFE